ncbi:serine protease [Streptomyces sp. NPDC097107]|uniref:serine protease n=1 Tax=Streptomyces sp. NPDC097107 TaxID=3366089 RepID=UPI0037FA32E9
MGACLAAGLQAGPATAIVGGGEANPLSHQFMAGLVDTKHRVFCGATLISPRYVVTAAHCLQGTQAQSLRVLLGDHDISKAMENPYTKLVQVDHIRVHENYNHYTQDADIALVRLVAPVERSGGIREAYLPWQHAPGAFDNVRVTAMGWGSQSLGGPASSVLQSVGLDTMTNAECVSRGMEDVTSGSICTHTPGRDTCVFDSGGPVTYDAGYPVLIGVISYGRGCATDSPSVSTRVSSYLQWIVQNTPDAVYETSGTWPASRR